MTMQLIASSFISVCKIFFCKFWFLFFILNLFIKYVKWSETTKTYLIESNNKLHKTVRQASAIHAITSIAHATSLELERKVRGTLLIKYSVLPPLMLKADRPGVDNALSARQ